MKAALYCRVSTEEQGKSGYSLRRQLEALRRYCNVHDLEVVGEFEDRASGASLDRPGLDALRDIVSAGGIDLVLCQDRDRLSREPAHHYVLREEFSGYSTALRALNDRGDDSPEGELTDGILDQLAKFERAKTAERTRRGKLRKAQEGKIVGTGKAPYGFYYADDHYHLDQDLMPFVHEIFDRIADGHSLYSTVQHLHKIGAPAPGGGRWHYATLGSIIRNDTYLGTFWWGKKKVTTTTVSMVENGERTYRKKVKRRNVPEKSGRPSPYPTLVSHPRPSRAHGRTSREIPDPYLKIAAGSGNSLVVWECALSVVAVSVLTPQAMPPRNATIITAALTGRGTPARIGKTIGQKTWNYWSRMPS